MTETQLNSLTVSAASNNYFYNKLHTHPLKTREELHKTFGGRIYNSDFSAERGNDNKSSSIGSRIETDFRWEDKLIAGKGDWRRYGW